MKKAVLSRFSEVLRRKRVASFHAAVFQAIVKPFLPLRAAAVGKALGYDRPAA